MKKILLLSTVLISSLNCMNQTTNMQASNMLNLINDLKVDELIEQLDENNPVGFKSEKTLPKEEIAKLKEFAQKRLVKAITDSNLSFFRQNGGFSKFWFGLTNTIAGISIYIGAGFLASMALAGQIHAPNPNLVRSLMSIGALVNFYLGTIFFNEGKKVLSDGWNMSLDNVKRAQKICWILNKIK